VTEKAYSLVYNDFFDYLVSFNTFKEERRRLCKPRLIVKVKQEIKEKIENDWQSKIEEKELLSDIKESDVKSDKGYDLLTRQLDFVQFP
jgi:DNA-binding transcriptional regulator GbsR (MarR family)